MRTVLIENFKNARFIADESGCITVFMTHNTDISDSWEGEADDPTYFYTFGRRGSASVSVCCSMQ